MRNEEIRGRAGSETGDACRQKSGGSFFKKSPHSPRSISETVFTNNSRQHLHPGKEPPAVGKAYFTIESAKHSH